MTTKSAGGKITGLLALTMEAQVGLDVGDPVMVTGPYEVGLNNGTKPLLGVVSVANKKRGSDGSYPVDAVPGDVTVEALGYYVRTVLSGGVFAAGVAVGFGGSGTLVAAGGGVATAGIALMPSTGAGQKIDVLFQ